jgi:hypothetical protein
MTSNLKMCLIVHSKLVRLSGICQQKQVTKMRELCMKKKKKFKRKQQQCQSKGQIHITIEVCTDLFSVDYFSFQKIRYLPFCFIIAAAATTTETHVWPNFSTDSLLSSRGSLFLFDCHDNSTNMCQNHNNDNFTSATMNQQKKRILNKKRGSFFEDFTIEDLTSWCCCFCCCCYWSCCCCFKGDLDRLKLTLYCLNKTSIKLLYKQYFL